MAETKSKKKPEEQTPFEKLIEQKEFTDKEKAIIGDGIRKICENEVNSVLAQLRFFVLYKGAIGGWDVYDTALTSLDEVNEILADKLQDGTLKPATDEVFVFAYINAYRLSEINFNLDQHTFKTRSERIKADKERLQDEIDQSPRSEESAADMPPEME